MKRSFTELVMGLFFCLIASSCDKFFDDIFWPGIDFGTFVNNSDHEVRVTITGREYPDTLYPQGRYFRDPIEAHKEQVMYIDPYYLDGRPTREQYFDEFPVVQVFVIDGEVHSNTRQETIRKYNLVLRRYEVTRDWMEQHNWKITYP